MVPQGTPEFYIFTGKDFKELLNLYTRVTGKPDLPPKWSFGLWFICRMYANDFEVMTDDEMHNFYSLLYSRQMYEGFKKYTGKRPCCFTPSGWAGIQKYTGTWTGDIGGGPKTLVACLNLALAGHSLVTCDMEVTTKEGIHYGFLMPWVQINSWNYFRHPWLQGNELFSMIKDYAQLRSQLVPYLYTYAYYAHITGIPIMRPLVLEIPDDSAAVVNNLNEYFLGRELLVTAFTEDIYLPEGQWLDYWNGKIYDGGKKFRYNPPARRRGGLFLRENSILPLGPLRQYTEESPREGFSLEIFINPDGRAEFNLYDDDGVTFAYEKGNYRIYHFRCTYEKSGIAVTIPEDLKVDTITLYTSENPDRFTVNGKTSVLNYSGNRGVCKL